MSILIPICFFILLILFVQYGSRYIWNYAIRPDSLDFVFFGVLCVKRISFDNIEEVREVPLRETWKIGSESSFARGLGNRLIGRVVLIRPKRGLFRRNVLITPDDVDEFLRQIQARLHKSDADKRGSDHSASGLNYLAD